MALTCRADNSDDSRRTQFSSDIITNTTAHNQSSMPSRKAKAEPVYSNPSHSFSKKWLAPHLRNQKPYSHLEECRERFCKESVAWTPDFDLPRHRRDVREALEKAQALKQKRKEMEILEKIRLGMQDVPPVEIEPALGGRMFSTNHSAVLAKQTVFTHEYMSTRTHEDHWGRVIEWHTSAPKELADWPTRAECKYEGDERISTDKLHRRFLCAPRVPGNETVNWMQRSIIPSYALEDFYYPAPGIIDIFILKHDIPDLQFDDDEGDGILGSELMEMLDE